jgi:WD40 repeat protein
LATVAADRELARYAYFDRSSQALVVRRFHDNAVLHNFPVPPSCDELSDIQFSADNTYLAARIHERGDGGDRAAVLIWTPAEREPVARIAAARVTGCPLDFSPDGQWLAIALADGSVALLATPEFGEVRTWEDERAACTVRFDRASKRLAVYRTGRLEVLDVASGKLTYQTACNSHVNQLDFSPDARLVAAACDDKVIRLWAPHSDVMQPLPMADDEELLRLRFQPQGRMLAASTRHGTTRL